MNIRVKQRDMSDCGAACLASVARFYNLDVPVARIRQHAGTDKKGTNIAGMMEAAGRLGFEAKGAKGTFESLFKIPLPAIAHVVFRRTVEHQVPGTHGDIRIPALTWSQVSPASLFVGIAPGFGLLRA